MKPLLISSKQFYEMLLLPVLRVRKFRHIKTQYRVLTDHQGNAQADEYMLLKSPKMGSRYGFEPYCLRQAFGEDPLKMAAFLLPITLGQMHPSVFAFLLSPYHQALVKAGQVAGFKALQREGTKQEQLLPSDRLTKDFDNAVAFDDDVRKMARKKNFSPSLERLILSERPHLLEKPT